ncbi:MAG: phosphatase PAP2 family protein [Ginsengibacter sp.]
MEDTVKTNISRVKDSVIVVIISLVYLIASAVFIGFKTNQLFLVCFFCAMYFASGATRKLILGFSVFIVYWIVFDYMKLFPNYRFQTVHIQDLYDLEKKFFAIKWEGAILTPNEFLIKHQTTTLDVLSGFLYLCWIPVPLFLAVYLFYKDRTEFLKFALTFFWINMLGFIIYYIYPAAPPWYMEQYGTAFNSATRGNTAGLQRFDAFFSVQVFHDLYAQSSNVFAAMPSLHSSYPLLVLYYGFRNRLGWINILFGLITIGIWFSAVYTGHHYLLDVLAGIVCCVIGTVSFNQLVKYKPVTKMLEAYLRVIR